MDNIDPENKKTDTRFNMFLNAVEDDKQKAAQLLADDPSLIEVRNSLGETVLHFLAVEDDIESVAWLLERGAKIDTVNDFGDTPLLDAAALDYADLCRFLLDHGANVRYINEETETSAFARAATVSTPAIATLKVLLEYLPADEDINHYFDSINRELALEHGGESAALLIERGLTPERRG